MEDGGDVGVWVLEGLGDVVYLLWGGLGGGFDDVGGVVVVFVGVLDLGFGFEGVVLVVVGPV